MYYTADDEKILLNYLLPTNQNDKYYTLQVYPIIHKLVDHIINSKQYSNIHDRSSVKYYIIAELYRKNTVHKFNIQSKSKMYSFLTTCITNEILMYIKKENRTINNQLKYFEEIKGDMIDEEYDYDNKDDEQLQAIDDALWCLKEHELIIYKMYFIERKTIKAISIETKVNQNYISNYLKEIRTKIREKIGVTQPMLKMYYRKGVSR